MKELLEKLENNRFIYKVRMDLEFDVKDYQELLIILNEIPKLTHIWYLNLKDDPNKNESSIVNQLEEAWIELDSIIGEEILGQGQ